MQQGTKSALGLAAFLGITFATTATAMWLSGPMPNSWYQTLKKPVFTPPPYIFPLVWTLLYILMSLAAWLVWRQRTASGAGAESGVRLALAVYFLQLLLNMLWAPLFFGLHSLPLAMLDCVLLLAGVMLASRLFFDVSALAGWLMLPYLCWTGFATLLTMSLWRMNA